MINKSLLFTIISLFFLSKSVYQQSYDLFLDRGLKSIPPDASLSPVELCDKYGYELDTNHSVTTQDGYILNMWHLTKKGGTASDKPVLMQHGLLATGHCFMCNIAELSPAFMLVENGFDVWLSNTRGNYFSRKHKTLNPDKDSQFWDFTFADMGRYDVPANLKYVLAQTGKKRMAYVGHSQGTMQMFYALSEIGDQLKDILMGFVALAPIARIGNVTSSLLHYLADFKVDNLVVALGIHQFLPQFWLVSQTAEWVCADLAFLCQDIIWLLFDAIPLADNIEREAVSYAFYPAGTSLKNMRHFAQLVRSKQFQEFDYGSTENKKRYGQSTPPIIDITKIDNVEIAIYSGGADELADPTDVAWLVTQIKEDVLKVNKQYEQMGHSTFNLGNADNMVFMESVYDFLNSLNWEAEIDQDTE